MMALPQPTRPFYSISDIIRGLGLTPEEADQLYRNDQMLAAMGVHPLERERLSLQQRALILAQRGKTGQAR